MELNLPM